MGAEPVSRDRRYSRDNLCPICGGWDGITRGTGHRCHGFRSADGTFARCSRDEHAGALPIEAKTACYVHKLAGDCACGIRHDPRPHDGPRFTLLDGAVPSRRPIRTIDYRVRGGNGVTVAIHRRREYAGGDKTVTWYQPDGTTAGLGGRKVESLPLYGGERLPERPGALVIVCEGEKAAQALTDAGWLAVGTVTGAHGTPGDAALTALHERPVVLWPDNDEPGHGHMARVGRALARLDTPARLLVWPDAPPKGDAADFLAAGGTPARLQALLDAAPAWTAETDWEPPLPLGTAALPPFPLDALPPVLRAFVAALAVATQTPPDLAGLLALAALATAAAGKVAVMPRAGWVEPVNLFAVAVLASGNRKSAVFRAIVAPLEAWERAELARLAGEHAAARTRRKIKEGALRKAEREAAEGKDAVEREAAAARAERHARELAGLPEPVEPQLIADDATPETVKTLLAEQGGRLALLSAEGTVFELMAGRYSQNGGPNLEVYLHGHAGDPIVVNRRGRRERIDRPALTVGVTVQPDVLRAFADKPAFRGRGLVARFLYALPESYVGRRDSDPPPVPEAARDAYTAMLATLLDLPLPPEPHRLVLDGHAAARFGDFRRAIEPQLGEFGRLGDMADWGSKLPGTVARIAGLLHLAAHADAERPWDEPIGTETMAGAIAIGEYASAHALAAATAMGLDPGEADARYLLRWVALHGGATFPKQAAWQGTRGRFEKAERLDQALDRLVAHRYLRPLPTSERTGPGRKPAPEYEVNPHHAPTIPITPTNTVDERDGANCRDSRDCRETAQAHDADDWGRV